MSTHDIYDRDILSFAAMAEDPELVRNIQIRLKEYGLSVDQVDGLYGSTTASALSTFVLYFSNRGVDVAAHAQDWHQV